MALINEKWVNITEATSILNLSVSTIRRRIKNKDKTLKFKKQGGVYLIQVPETETETTNVQEQDVEKLKENLKVQEQDVEKLKKQQEQDVEKLKKQIENLKVQENKQSKTKEMSEQEKMLLDSLIKDNQNKTKLIEDLTKQVGDMVKTNQQVVFMLNDLRHQLPGGKKEEEIFEVVSKERGDVDTQPTKDKKQLWKYPVYVLILLTTLGLIGLMLYQSGLITL